MNVSLFLTKTFFIFTMLHGCCVFRFLTAPCFCVFYRHRSSLKESIKKLLFKLSCLNINELQL